jgi:hypothetical protein
MPGSSSARATSGSSVDIVIESTCPVTDGRNGLFNKAGLPGAGQTGKQVSGFHKYDINYLDLDSAALAADNFDLSFLVLTRCFFMICLWLYFIFTP